MKAQRFRFSLLVLATIPSLFCNAQHYGAYTDYMDKFWVFEKGKSTKIEDLRPQAYMVGGEGVLYINSAGKLMLYADGQLSQLELGGVNLQDLHATDHLIVYNIFEKLKAVQNGEVIELSSRCPIYRVQDSLVAFYDKNKESLRVFYHGQVQDIESGMIGVPVEKFAAGDNIVAYVSSRTKDFKVWYQGEVTTLIKNVADIKFKAGKDVVAYIDPLDQVFKAFYKGEIYTLSDFNPQSFNLGDGFIAFVDQMGEFKYFSNGEVTTISTIPPDGYLCEDYSLAYVQNGRFMIWHNMQALEMEAWVPSVYKIDWNTIAYLDNSQRIWIIQNGEKKFFSNELVNSFDIYRDLIEMNVKVDRNIIYYMGEFYEGESFYR